MAEEVALTEDSKKRTEYPMAEGLLDYFPNALAEVSRLSYLGTLQHHPGEPMHWDRGKSMDHANKVIRHLMDRGKMFDIGGHKIRHMAAAAWRCLAELQEEIEREEGAPTSRASLNADQSINLRRE